MIRYRKGYKYQLADDFVTTVSWHLKPPNGDIVTEFVELRSGEAMSPGGRSMVCVLLIKSGYAWDGPSGPTIDTPSFMRGSLVHDALYQLMREKHLPFDSTTRIAADVELIKQCREAGMSWLRRQWVWAALRLFGSGAANPTHEKKVIEAP